MNTKGMLSTTAIAAGLWLSVVLPSSANTVTIVGNLGTDPTATSSAPLIHNNVSGTFADAWTFVLSNPFTHIVVAQAQSTYADLASFIGAFQVSVWSFGADNTAGTADDLLRLGPSFGLGAPPPNSQSATVAGNLGPGSYYFQVAGNAPTVGSNASYTGSVDTTAPVPGPIVGAGLPGLLAAGAGLLALARRRKRQAATA